MRRLAKLAVLAVVVLPGCAVTTDNAYPEAQNARECQVFHEAAMREARQNMANTQTQSTGNFLADAFARGLGRGMAEGVLENRYQTCLARVSDTGTPLYTPEIERQQDYNPYAGCAAGGGVLQGGSSYCVGQ